MGGITRITSLSIPAGGSIKNMNWPPTLNENTTPKRVGLNVVWGCEGYSPELIKPIAGLPLGRRKYKARPKAPFTVYVKTATGIQKFYVVIDENGEWYGLHQGANQRI